VQPAAGGTNVLGVGGRLLRGAGIVGTVYTVGSIVIPAAADFGESRIVAQDVAAQGVVNQNVQTLAVFGNYFNPSPATLQPGYADLSPGSGQQFSNLIQAGVRGFSRQFTPENLALGLLALQDYANQVPVPAQDVEPVTGGGPLAPARQVSVFLGPDPGFIFNPRQPRPLQWLRQGLDSANLPVYAPED
jgi:hypothetical protein